MDSDNEFLQEPKAAQCSCTGNTRETLEESTLPNTVIWHII